MKSKPPSCVQEPQGFDRISGRGSGLHGLKVPGYLGSTSGQGGGGMGVGSWRKLEQWAWEGSRSDGVEQGARTPGFSLILGQGGGICLVGAEWEPRGLGSPPALGGE